MIGLTSGWVTTVLSRVAVMALACALAAVVAYRHGHSVGAAKVQASWDAEKAEVARAHAEEIMKARKKELSLQRLADRLRSERVKDLARAHADTQRVLDSLRDRPETRAGAGGVPEAPGAGVGCTGEGLAKGDGEFLARYAADARRLQAAYDECRVKYDEVKRQVDLGLNGPVVGRVNDGGDR